MTSRRPDVAAICARLHVPAAPGHFDPATIASLPRPAQRYLSAAIEPGAPLALAARITMVGSIKLGARWVRFSGEETLAPHDGFCWTARTRVGIAGSDHYAAGAGALDWRLFGLIPVMRASGPHIARSAAGRAAGEAAWIPTTLVPQPGTTWEERDGDDHVAVRIDTDGHQTTIELIIDELGRLTQASYDRWGDPDGSGTFASHRFVMEATDHATFGSLTVPAAGVVGWQHGTEWSPEDAFFRYRLTGIELIEDRTPSAPTQMRQRPDSRPPRATTASPSARPDPRRGPGRLGMLGATRPPASPPG